MHSISTRGLLIRYLHFLQHNVGQTQQARKQASDMSSSSVPVITIAAESSDLELHTDSSSSGGSPRMDCVRASPTAALLALVVPRSPHNDDKDDVTTSHVSIKPNLKLMSNSERGKYYRRKRKNYAAELSASVNKLRRQVQTLVAAQQLRQELIVGYRQTPLGSLAKLVHEYCAQFEYGTPLIVAPIISNYAYPGATTMQLARVAAPSSQQARFLHATMEERVGFGEFNGIPLLLDQWERYSKYHAALRFELKSLDVVSPHVALIADDDETEDTDDFEPALPVIVVRADLHVRYSLETIEQIFPHLLSDVPLMQKLIGLEVSYPCVNHFYFSASGKIERYNPEVDFMGALAAKIRSLAGVAHVLSRALIAKDHMIGILDREDADASHNEPQLIEIQYDEDTATTDTKNTRSRKASSGVNAESEARSMSPVQSKPTSRLDLDFILS